MNFIEWIPTFCFFLTIWAPNPQNDQTHSNILSVKANELFECVAILWGWPLKG